MYTSQNRRVGEVLLVCVSLLMGGVVPLAAQPEPSSTALRLITAAYPDLRGLGATAHIEGRIRGDGGPWMREFAVEIRDGNDNSVQTLPALVRLRTVLFNAAFYFMNDGLFTYYARGRTVKAPENEDFERTLAKHPAWSDVDIASALTTHGAAFGPATVREMTDEANRLAAAVADVFGYGAVVVAAVVFEFPSADDRKAGRGDCFWRIVYKPPSTNDVELRATFEPFGGKLVALSRLP